LGEEYCGEGEDRTGGEYEGWLSDPRDERGTG
jgi:hypothetical protein